MSDDEVRELERAVLANPGDQEAWDRLVGAVARTGGRIRPEVVVAAVGSVVDAVGVQEAREAVRVAVGDVLTAAVSSVLVVVGRGAVASDVGRPTNADVLDGVLRALGRTWYGTPETVLNHERMVTTLNAMPDELPVPDWILIELHNLATNSSGFDFPGEWFGVRYLPPVSGTLPRPVPSVAGARVMAANLGGDHRNPRFRLAAPVATARPVTSYTRGELRVREFDALVLVLRAMDHVDVCVARVPGSAVYSYSVDHAKLVVARHADYSVRLDTTSASAFVANGASTGGVERG